MFSTFFAFFFFDSISKPLSHFCRASEARRVPALPDTMGKQCENYVCQLFWPTCHLAMFLLIDVHELHDASYDNQDSPNGRIHSNRPRLSVARLFIVHLPSMLLLFFVFTWFWIILFIPHFSPMVLRDSNSRNLKIKKRNLHWFPFFVTYHHI